MDSFCNNEDEIGGGLNHVTSTAITEKDMASFWQVVASIKTGHG